MVAMKPLSYAALRALLPCVATGLLAGAAGLASAQTPAQPAASPAPQAAQATGAVESRVERITVEDAGTRIEEWRVGGQTRRIDVQSKTAVPGYQVQPLQETAPGAGGGAGTAAGQGKSSWRVLNF